MKAPRNEVEANAVMHPVERRGIRFAGHMHPAAAIKSAKLRRRKPRTFWQRITSVFRP